MKENFKRVEKHLYRRQYQTAGGEWSTLYYGIFTDWQGIRRTFPLGNALQDARDALGGLRNFNKGRYDWDAERKKMEERRRREVTFLQWGCTYFEKNLNPNTEMCASSDDRENRSFAHLKAFFGDLPLVEIRKGKILEYRKKRGADGVEFTTINRELSFLRKLLNVAADQDEPIIETVPRFKLPSESSRARTRTLDEDEYTTLLSHMQRRAQRYVIALREAAMRRNEPQALTWAKVDLKAGLIRLAAADVKEKHPRRTPITWELREVFLEIKEEQKRLANVSGYVFTRKNGQPMKSIRTAFERARNQAKLTDVVPHDLRRTAITSWTELGIPRDVVMAASGHKPVNVHDRYLNFSDKQLTEAFQAVDDSARGPDFVYVAFTRKFG